MNQRQREQLMQWAKSNGFLVYVIACPHRHVVTLVYTKGPGRYPICCN